MNLSAAHSQTPSLQSQFRLDGKTVLITGGAGLLGREHATAVLEAGGRAILGDLDFDRAREVARSLDSREENVQAVHLDVSSRGSAELVLEEVLARCGSIDVLVNNAARNPKVEAGLAPQRFENQSIEDWEADLAIGLRGSFIMSQVVGKHLAQKRSGVIINIASDLGLIAPDQRIYREEGVPKDSAPVKPITYSVVKGGLIMMTKYLATYWAEDGVRVNALCPGGVFAGQPERFVKRLTQLIPMGRMARKDEYRAALVFLAAEASSYMTGTTLVLDGGRTCW